MKTPQLDETCNGAFEAYSRTVSAALKGNFSAPGFMSDPDSRHAFKGGGFQFALRLAALSAHAITSATLNR